MKDDDIIQMLRDLEIFGIKSTDRFYKNIVKLINTDKIKFIKEFSKDMKFIDINAYNRFERLYPNTDKQKKILANDELYRYEYRRSNKNVKCIFVLIKSDGTRVLLNAFNEDGDKQKGNDSYKKNIELAIQILSEIKGEIL